MGLDDLRQKIDEIDKNIAYWLEKRFQTVAEVAEEKKKSGVPVLNSSREKEVIQNALSHLKEDTYKQNVAQSFEALMAVSRRMQAQAISLDVEQPVEKTAGGGKTAAYCGIEGSYAEEALSGYFDDVDQQPKNSFEDVAQSVALGLSDYGLLPVENSSAGPVTAVEDLLADTDIYITGEVVLPVSHLLLGVPGAREEDIKKVVSHPQAIEQCRRFISERGYEVELSGNTAFAARQVAQSGDKTLAAIASQRAGEIYGLQTIRENIQTSADNYTRFVVIENKPKETGDKISLVCVIPHQPGSLYTLLSIFAKHQLNLLKLLSRPLLQSPWHYRFHIDLAGNFREENVRLALEEARRLCETMKITGCYYAGGTL
jgi:chorismate mutase/prephenate dehydratase